MAKGRGEEEEAEATWPLLIAKIQLFVSVSVRVSVMQRVP